MVMPAASAAPLLTPIKPGSASGLRNRPCISAPDRPSPAPAASPKNRRGRRMLRNTSCSGEPSSPPEASAHSVLAMSPTLMA